MLLQQYGILRHCAAVKAELCVGPHIRQAIHNMMLTIRASKSPSGEVLLKASPKPLPRFEPWKSFICKAPNSLPALAMIQSSRRQDSIQARGEQGRGRDIKPISFTLRCPHCKTNREARGNKLFSFKALGLNCSSCARATTSTRWICTHGTPWHLCSIHREAGLRCGKGLVGSSGACTNGTSTSKQNNATKPNPKQAAELDLKRQQKLKRVGELGNAIIGDKHPKPSMGSKSGQERPRNLIDFQARSIDFSGHYPTRSEVESIGPPSLVPKGPRSQTCSLHPDSDDIEFVQANSRRRDFEIQNRGRRFFIIFLLLFLRVSRTEPAVAVAIAVAVALLATTRIVEDALLEFLGSPRTPLSQSPLLEGETRLLFCCPVKGSAQNRGGKLSSFASFATISLAYLTRLFRSGVYSRQPNLHLEGRLL